MDTLKTIFSKVKCFESNTKLHAIVFIAQEINIIGKNEYNFDYSLNLPFSESLERDYLMLRDEGFVYEDEEGHIVVNDQLNESVNASQIDKIDKLIDEEKISILQKLSIFETKDLINISRLIYLRKVYPDIKDDSNKLEEKARNMFFISNQSFKDIFNRLNNLHANLAFGEV